MKTPTREQANLISIFIDAEKQLVSAENAMHNIREEFKEKY